MWLLTTVSYSKRSFTEYQIKYLTFKYRLLFNAVQGEQIGPHGRYINPEGQLKLSPPVKRANYSGPTYKSPLYKVTLRVIYRPVYLSCGRTTDFPSKHDDVIIWKHFPRYWPFVREFTGLRWIPCTKASDADVWGFLWSVSKYTVEKTIVRLVIWGAIAPSMTSL